MLAFDTVAQEISARGWIAHPNGSLCCPRAIYEENTGGPTRKGNKATGVGGRKEMVTLQLGCSGGIRGDARRKGEKTKKKKEKQGRKKRKKKKKKK